MYTMSPLREVEAAGAELLRALDSRPGDFDFPRAIPDLLTTASKFIDACNAYHRASLPAGGESQRPEAAQRLGKLVAEACHRLSPLPAAVQSGLATRDSSVLALQLGTCLALSGCSVVASYSAEPAAAAQHVVRAAAALLPLFAPVLRAAVDATPAAGGDRMHPLQLLAAMVPLHSMEGQLACALKVTRMFIHVPSGEVRAAAALNQLDAPASWVPWLAAVQALMEGGSLATSDRTRLQAALVGMLANIAYVTYSKSNSEPPIFASLQQALQREPALLAGLLEQVLQHTQAQAALIARLAASAAAAGDTASGGRRAEAVGKLAVPAWIGMLRGLRALDFGPFQWLIEADVRSGSPAGSDGGGISTSTNASTAICGSNDSLAARLVHQVAGWVRGLPLAPLLGADDELHWRVHGAAAELSGRLCRVASLSRQNSPEHAAAWQGCVDAVVAAIPAASAALRLQLAGVTLPAAGFMLGSLRGYAWILNFASASGRLGSTLDVCRTAQAAVAAGGVLLRQIACWKKQDAAIRQQAQHNILITTYFTECLELWQHAVKRAHHELTAAQPGQLQLAAVRQLAEALWGLHCASCALVHENFMGRKMLELFAQVTMHTFDAALLAMQQLQQHAGEGGAEAQLIARQQHALCIAHPNVLWTLSTVAQGDLDHLWHAGGLGDQALAQLFKLVPLLPAAAFTVAEALCNCVQLMFQTASQAGTHSERAISELLPSLFAAAMQSPQLLVLLLTMPDVQLDICIAAAAAACLDSLLGEAQAESSGGGGGAGEQLAGAVAQANAAADALAAAAGNQAAEEHQMATMQAAAEQLAQALLVAWKQPEPQAVARLEVAQAAATCRCAYPGCHNRAVLHCGPAAGQGGGSKKCGGCRAVWYCGTECSHADWKDNHRRVCKGLAILRQQEEEGGSSGSS